MDEGFVNKSLSLNNAGKCYTYSTMKKHCLLKLYKAQIFVFAGMFLFANHHNADAGKPTHYGWVEQVYLLPYKTKFDAKLDTGAKNSSLHAKDISYFERDGARWVKFTVPLKKQALTFERPLYDYSKIKLRATTHSVVGKTYIKRPEVLMTLCIGNQKAQIVVNLADRKRFLYPMLIGRETLIELNALVDSNNKNITKPQCSQEQND